MRDVVVPVALLEAMKDHARETYPDECCGFLIGPESDPPDNGARAVQALERARNEFNGERRRRFLILPSELRDTELRWERSGLGVVGFYHSHPDHPARPSQFDQEHAWPWYSYVVLSVTRNDVPAAGAFELDPDSSTFREVRLDVIAKSGPADPVVRG